VLGVLLLSGLLYVGLIVSWTLQTSTRDTRPSSLDEATGEEATLLQGGEEQPLTRSSSTQDDFLETKHWTSSLAAAVDLPSNSSQIRRFQCLSFRATAECNPDASRRPHSDQDCSSIIPEGTSGYCEIEDLDSLERFKVMKRTCDKGAEGAAYRCVDAPGFANFRAKAQRAVGKALVPGYALPNMDSSDVNSHQGIVMVVYPEMVPSIYATVRTLREVLSCELPVEIWLRPDEMDKHPGVLEPLWDLAKNKSVGDITFQAIRHPQATLFNTKIYAIYHSKFQQVLFLDADNVPVKDPSYLFKTNEFVDTGAVFWPDFWHPDNTIFSIDETSLVWELLGTDFVDMFEQESGQLLIDRKRHAAPLSLVIFYAFHQPDLFTRLRLSWGDKDLYRFAWLKLGAPFHMIRTPPAVAGEVKGDVFCGMTMAQHDPSGKFVFLHRNQLKLTGDTALKHFDPRLKKMLASSQQRAAQLELGGDGYPDPEIWTHLVSFRSTSPRFKYNIEKHAVMSRVTGLQRCFGGPELDRNPYFEVHEFFELSFSGLELHLRRFAMQAVQLQQQWREGAQET
jgi:alpha 1,2-mannosyltransferase